jgi:hypothetical protein
VSSDVMRGDLRSPRTTSPHGGNPRTCDRGSAIDSQRGVAGSFQKLYEHCQQCVVKDGDYFEDQ